MNIPNTSYQSPQCLVLRFMRENKQLSLQDVAKKIEIKAKVIDHMENGRKVITEEQIKAFLRLYEYSFEVFTEMLSLKPLTKQSTNQYFITKT